jgi:hypothetical protein
MMWLQLRWSVIGRIALIMMFGTACNDTTSLLGFEPSDIDVGELSADDFSKPVIGSAPVLTNNSSTPAKVNIEDNEGTNAHLEQCVPPNCDLTLDPGERLRIPIFVHAHGPGPFEVQCHAKSNGTRATFRIRGVAALKND